MISINFINFYPYKEWFFYYKRFTYCKGIHIRLFGMHIKIMEKDATKKLIELANKMRNC